MGERTSTVTIQARFESDEAVGGVRALKDELTGLGTSGGGEALEKVGAAAESAAPAAAALADGMKQVAPAAEEAAGATDRLDAAVVRLDAASGRGLLRAITQAKVEVAALEEQLAALGGPGAAGAAEIEAAIQRANVSVEQGINKFAIYKEKLREVNEEVKLGVASHAAFGSGLGGVGQAVAGVTTKFGQLALAGAGLTLAIEGPKMAFEALKKAGEFLGEAMAKVVEKSSEHAAKLQEIALEEQKFELAMRQVEKGTISLGGSLGELSQNYKLLSVASGTASDAVVAAMDKIAGAKQPVIQGFDDLAKAGDAMGALVEGSFHKSQFAGDQFATQNAARIRELQKMYQEFGEAMPAGLRKAVDALDALAAKQRAMNEEMRRLNKEYTTDLTAQYGALEKTIQAYKDGNLTRDQAISGLEKEAAALIKAGDAAGLSAKQKLEMAKAIDSARERMESEVVSTDAASEATRALAEAMDKLKAAMPRTVEEIEKQTRAAAEYARAMNEAKQATEDMATAQQQTADMMKAANLGGVMEQLAGGVSKAAAGTMATMTLMETHTVYASEQMVAAVKNVSAAFKELATTNSDMADRAANAVALLQEAWQSGIADMQSWLRQWHLYYDQLEQMIAKNPGSKVAKDLQKVVDMLDELKKRVESGEIQPGEKINL